MLIAGSCVERLPPARSRKKHLSLSKFGMPKNTKQNPFTEFIITALSQYQSMQPEESATLPGDIALSRDPKWATFRVGTLPAGWQKFNVIGRCMSEELLGDKGVLAVVIANDEQGNEIPNPSLSFSKKLKNHYVYLKPSASGLFRQLFSVPTETHELHLGFCLWSANEARINTTVTLSNGRDSLLAHVGKAFNSDLCVSKGNGIWLPIKDRAVSQFLITGNLPSQLQVKYWEDDTEQATSTAHLASRARTIGEIVVPSKGRSSMVELSNPDGPIVLNPYLRRVTLPRKMHFDRWQSVEPTRSEKLPLKIAAILDEFSAECFAPEADFLFLSSENWQSEIEEFKPDFFFAESAWQGNKGQWAYQFSKFKSKRGEALDQLLAYCRQIELPTVFWNKEDPPNFDIFVDVATEFDYVFTTDENCVPKYIESGAHKGVHSLMFAAQPRLHNPVGKREDDAHSIAFAGSWYAKHPNRITTLPYLLKASLAYDLHIFNRQSSLDDERYAFPDLYYDNLYEALPYRELITAHRKYKVMLNSNSVSDSPTMFARRVFEILASATPIVSTPSIGVERVFGNIVPVIGEETQAEREIARLMDDDDYRHQMGHMGYREVMQNHCCSHRLRRVAESIGLPLEQSVDPKVCVVGCTNRPEFVGNLISNFERQTYPAKELILVVNGDNFDEAQIEQQVARVKNASWIHMPESYSLGECLNEAIARSDADLISKMDDDDFYGKNYLSDMCLPFKYTNAGIVGKRAVYFWLESLQKLVLRNPGKDHRYGKLVSGSTLVFTKKLWSELSFTRQERGTDTDFLTRAAEQRVKIYSADRYNHIAFRRTDKNSHTWKIDDEDILAKSQLVADSLDLSAVEI